jgi:hypothetical protein
LRCEPEEHTRVARRAARLAVVWNGRAELPLRARFFSGGLARPVRRWPRAATVVEALRPTLVRPLARASCPMSLRSAHAQDRACSHTATPRERAPRQDQAKQRYSSACSRRQEQKRNITRRLNAVIPAQAGIQTHATPGKSEQRRASSGSVSGYGSWAPLKRPRDDSGALPPCHSGRSGGEGNP